MSQRMGGMHEWIFYMRLQTPPGDYFPCEGSEDTQCTKTIKKDLGRGTSDSLKDALVALLYSPELMVRDTISERGSLIIMKMGIA